MEWKDISSVFRIFDIAFFIPGAALTGALYARGMWSWSMLPLPGAGGESASTLLIILLLALASYLLGIASHALGRGIAWVVELRPGAPATEPPWFGRLDRAELTHLTMYFWYLRSAAANLTAAAVVNLGLWLLSVCGVDGIRAWGGRDLAVSALLMVVFFCAAWDFERGFRRAAGVLPTAKS